MFAELGKMLRKIISFFHTSFLVMVHYELGNVRIDLISLHGKPFHVESIHHFIFVNVIIIVIFRHNNTMHI